MKRIFTRLSQKTVSVFLIFVLCLSAVSCGKDKSVEEDAPVEKVSQIGDLKENTLKFGSNGTIIDISVEDYNGTDIEPSEVESYINSEINTYNNEKGIKKVSLDEFQVDSGIVKSAIQYADLDTYNEFNGTDIVLSMYDIDDANKIAEEEAEEAASKNDADQVALDTASISDSMKEELAEAGYDLSDLDSLESSINEATELDAVVDKTATFTDASTLEVLAADQISEDAYMMLILSEDTNVTISGGSVLYTNRHATAENGNTAKTDGKGRAIIVFTFNF